jgi:hypothetical protein
MRIDPECDPPGEHESSFRSGTYVRIFQAPYRSRTICFSASNEGDCLYSFVFTPFRGRARDGRPTGSDNPIWVDVPWVFAGERHAMCMTTGRAGIAIGAWCAAIHGERRRCPLSWRVDDGESR